MLLLLHGAVGNLDELLACAGGIALVLVIIFVVELLANRKKSLGVESQESNPESPAPSPNSQISNPQSEI